MSKLVQRLRNAHPMSQQAINGSTILVDAADKIEQLQMALEVARECLGACIGTPDWYRAKAAIAEALANQQSTQEPR